MALKEEFRSQGNWLFRHRSFLPIIPLVIALFVYIQSSINSEYSGINNTYFEIIAILISILGLIVRIITVGHTPKNTSGRNTKIGQLADSVNTTGIYSVVRHPLYLGNFLMWLGIAVWTINLWFIVAFCLFYWLYYERIMYAEEEFLRDKFGKQYIQWAETTPAFIPDFKKYIKPIDDFNWKKVLRQEKNGLFALFFIFCTFHILAEVITQSYQFNYILIAITILTGLIYLILKILKKNTNVLRDKE